MKSIKIKLRRKTLFNILFFVALCFQTNAQQPGSEINFRSIDDYITSKMRFPRIPGIAVAIVKGDKVIYVKGYGQADPSGRPVTPKTSFIIGSVTKSFTALAVMQLVEAGKVGLNAPVQKYIPWFRVADSEASAKITVQQLLYQTSGLPMIRAPQLWTGPDDKALERTVRILQAAKLGSPPGQTFAYSNANYETLGMIIQMVSGQPYEDYIIQHIFQPLDMQNSFVSQEKALQNGMASGYRWWFGIPVPVTFPYNRFELPAGYIISSAEDMAHYMIAQVNGGRYGDSSILSPRGITLAHTQLQPNTYAMGWESHRFNDHQWVNHDGGTANFQCSLFLDPEKHVGVFIAANAMCALDAFSSPHGSDVLDGSTVRAMAKTVLSMATNQPRPDEGHGLRPSYIALDLALLILTVLLLNSILRISKRHRRLKAQKMITRPEMVRRIVLIALLHLTWPLVVFYIAGNVFFWKILLMFQPDLVYWLEAVAIIVFLKGLIEIILVLRLFGLKNKKNIWPDA